MSETGNSPRHDDNLSQAIAESIASLDYLVEDNGEPENQNNPDLDLESTINNVFQQLDFQKGGEKEPTEEPKEKEEAPTEEPAKDEGNFEPLLLHPLPPDKQESLEQWEEGDFDLEAAIGNAFNQAFDKRNLLSQETHEPEPEKKEHLPDASEQEERQHPREQSEAATQEEDLDLDAAIGDAFKSIRDQIQAPPAEHELDLELDAAIGDAFKAIADQRPQHTELVYDSQRVSYLIRKPVVTEQLVRSIGRALMEEVAFTRESTDEDIDSVISRAFRSAMEPDKGDERRKSVDLANVVHEIVSQIQDDTVSDSSLPVSEDVLQELAVEITNHLQLEHPEEKHETLMNSIITNAFHTALERKPRADEPKPTDKGLSIAETLALHRLTMSRDTEDTGRLQNKQLSQVLLSLSNHINSTSGSDNNIVQVIRQMTNALAASKSRTYFQTNPIKEIFSRYTDLSERDKMVGSLMLAKKYLDEQNDVNASDLIQRSTQMFEPKPLGVAATVFPVKNEDIANISESIISVIHNYSGTRIGRNAFIFDKPSADSPEYRERIRIENRERKKKWREGNAERNKDNDLRSRVIKRATAMFGEKDSPEKREWMDQEFARRREKRLAKQKAEEKPDVNEKKTDPKHIQYITDIFNIVSVAGMKDEAKAVLNATAAATATAIIVFTGDVKSSVTSIMNLVIDGTINYGQADRVRALSRMAQSLRNSPEVLEFDLEKRQSEGDHELPHPKRQASSVKAPAWNSSWRIPTYKRLDKPEAGFQVSTPTLTLSAESPFISNKVQASSAPVGLRRPGTFQRPPYKTKPKPGVPLYSSRT